MTEMKFRS